MWQVVAVICILGVKLGRGELLDLSGEQNRKKDAYNLPEGEDWSVNLSDYDTFEEAGKLVPEEGVDYRNSNANITCGAACSYSILGVAGVASFLANRFLQQRPAASSRRALDVGKLHAELMEAKERVENVNKKIEIAWKMAAEDVKKKREKEKYSYKRSEKKNKGLIDHLGNGLTYALEYAQEKDRPKHKSKKGYRNRKRGHSESVKDKFERVGSVVGNTMKMVNPLNPFKFWMDILKPKQSSKRKYSKSRYEQRRRYPYDYSYRKNRYNNKYRSIDYDDYYYDEKITNHNPNAQTEGKDNVKPPQNGEKERYFSQKDPGYFDGFIDTFKKNKDLIKKENTAAAIEESDDDELKKSIDANFKKGFGVIYDKNFKDPWGEIHEPKTKLKLAKYYGKENYYDDDENFRY